MNPIIPCLWLNDNIEEAVNFYVGIFPDAKITALTRYPASDQPSLQDDEGQILTIDFTLRGQSYTALNGGPGIEFTPAVSFQIICEDQAETDYYWEKLSDGGDPEAQQCGWLKDRYGLSWQIVPKAFLAIVLHAEEAARTKAFRAMRGMKKLDLAALQAAVA